MSPTLQGQNISLLYAEDDPATRTQVTRFLEASGYRCIVAENGSEGLELYRRHTPDIVLSDIKMPVMNGLEMARHIREEFPEALFIFMTAFGDTKYLLEAIDIGVSQFVSKPVEFKKLLAAITHCVHTIRLKAEAQHTRHLEAISILAGGIAHDFNNLLQVVMGYISLAHMHADPDSKNFEYLTMALKGVDQARELGLRLTTLAKGNDSPKQTKSIEPIIISTINAAFSNTNIRCEFNLPADIPTVHFNEEQLQQVISHLAENARDAMPLGGILRVVAQSQTISSSDGLMLPPGDYLHLTFTDSGTGIPADVLPKVFDPYFTTKDMGSKKGQGLGLTVCNTIIRGHGGMISAESAPGNGTTIHIWLPAATEEND